MENFIEKYFINRNLGIKFKSYIDEDCNVWFKAKDVAEILGYKKTRNAINKHVSQKYKKEAPIQGPLGGEQNCIIINEPGFYELVFKSKLPTAIFFREWVFDKVLPSIRKYGYYNKFKKENKRLIIVDGVEYYKHQIFSDYAANKDGDIYSLKKNKILNKNKDSNGYLYFRVYNKKLEKSKSYYYHRFVYEVFRGPIPRCFEIDHINSCKSDNRLKNLQILTHKQNVGKSKNKAIISTCIEDGKERRFISMKKASNELGISSDKISKICRNKYKSTYSKKDKKKYRFRYLD